MQRTPIVHTFSSRHIYCGFRCQPQFSKRCEVSSSLGALPQRRTGILTLGSNSMSGTCAQGKRYGSISAATQQAEERTSSNAEASTSNASTSEPILTRKQSQESVADKLIDLFATKTPEEWRKLIAFSKQWSTLADRCAILLNMCLLYLPASFACRCSCHFTLQYSRLPTLESITTCGLRKADQLATSRHL